MKQLHIMAACAALLIAFSAGAQNVAINADGSLPNAGAMLDITPVMRISYSAGYFIQVASVFN